ncbi:MAG: type II toxin-antitoxin system HicA family toxin [Verrucomicrobia bacterium]|nr:type II toxin-antitoxin system HicA family toxin [Verrucomicrobiota bacterium]
MKLKDLEQHMRLHGCLFKREGGAHTIWENPTNGAWSAVPRHREVKDHLARRICKQLEIPSP